MADILGFPYGYQGSTASHFGHGDLVERPCDVEPPCEGNGNIDNVLRPAHYVRGNVEAIEVIEHVVSGYTDPIEAGLIWQVLKYLIRAPFKGDKSTDLRKAQFYLNRAVSKLG